MGGLSELFDESLAEETYTIFTFFSQFFSICLFSLSMRSLFTQPSLRSSMPAEHLCTCMPAIRKQRRNNPWNLYPLHRFSCTISSSTMFVASQTIPNMNQATASPTYRLGLRARRKEHNASPRSPRARNMKLAVAVLIERCMNRTTSTCASLSFPPLRLEFP